MQQELDAPNLVSELRKRFADVKFDESIVHRKPITSDPGAELEIYDYPVLSGQERIGLYTVQTRAGRVISKRYQHNGRFLVVRGRLTEKEYRELQHLVEAGNLDNALVQMESLGTRNYVVHDFLTLGWSPTRGREDRYLNDIAFP